MKNLNYLMLIGLGIIVLALATMNSDPVIAVLAFTGFFGVPKNEGAATIALTEEGGIKKLADDVYSSFCEWRKLVKETNLLKIQSQEIMANNPEFENSAFKSQIQKSEKQFQLYGLLAAAWFVDFFLVNDALADVITQKIKLIPADFLILGGSLAFLIIEIVVASYLDKRNQADGSKDESKLKYLTMLIVPMLAASSFLNDYMNNDGGMGSIFFFAGLTILSLITHYIAIKNAKDFIALTAFQIVDKEVSKLKKQFEPLAKNAINIEAQIEKNMGILFEKVYDYQQKNPESTTNFLLLMPGGLRSYFNKLMGYEAMPMPEGYVPTNGWSNSLYEHLLNEPTQKVLQDTSGTANPNPIPEAGGDVQQPDNNGGNGNNQVPNTDPFTDFFGGEKRV